MERPAEADDRSLNLIALAGLAATAIGVAWLEPTDALGFGRSLGFLSQLATTGPAALLVLAAFGANVAAGAILVRLALRRPFASITEAALTGLAGAVTLDAVLLFALGALGWFRMPLLLAIHVVILGAGWWRRPVIERARLALPRPGTLAWLVFVPFAGAVLLQLASPVVPFLDVLPNHVAPVEHLRTFGAYATLDVMPSPIYGPSRAFLGYTSVLGVVATMTGLPAALAVAASILPQALLVALGVRRLARSLVGVDAEIWALLAFLLTASFGRLTDARANILVLPLLFWALARFHDRWADAPADGDDDAEAAVAPDRLTDGRLIGLGLGAALLVHPLLALFGAAVIALVSVIEARRAADVGISALALAAAIAIPQAATTLGTSLPAWAGIIAIPAVVLADVAVRRLGFVRDSVVWAGWIALLAAVPASIVFIDPLFRGLVGGLGPVLTTMPLLLVAATAGVVLARASALSPVILAGFGVGAAVAALAQLAPDGDLLGQTIHFELPKELDYWLPALMVFPAAAGLAALARGTSTAGDRSRAALLAVFVVTAALPVRSTAIDDHHRGEHRFSEAVAIDLRWADRGYWHNYPNSRQIVDPPRQALLDAVRAEIAAGRIGPTTSVLHVASSFQQWVATPLGVFTGVIETDVTPDAVVEIHTIGGRLRPLSDLSGLLADRRYSYVLFEPAGLEGPGVRESIASAGYASIFGNSQGELFSRH
ncbi:MAG TPA: hypothetical protein VFC71_02575 [Candidatus Polarisedimenticolia bacterium]|nr:hypothetical protein [Candidatus Polarisedimenticolia bacterium]